MTHKLKSEEIYHPGCPNICSLEGCVLDERGSITFRSVNIRYYCYGHEEKVLELARLEESIRTLQRQESGEVNIEGDLPF